MYVCTHNTYLASYPSILNYILTKADIISTVEFNHDGEYLATGDKGGRVVIFQRGGLPVVSYSSLQVLVQLDQMKL